MSWQDWCKNIETGGFIAGGIYGHDGNPWAEFGMNDTYKLTPADVQGAIECMNDSDAINKFPVKVGNCKQTAIRAGNGEFLGKHLSQMCLVALDCKQCVIVGIGGEGVEPRGVLDHLYKIADQLKTAGY